MLLVIGDDDDDDAVYSTGKYSMLSLWQQQRRQELCQSSAGASRLWRLWLLHRRRQVHKQR